ncbi:UbcM4-interacting protein 4 [Intoshia linei]|uniref:RBR-type E3 ubiquitin transferase n=1 Tax=Intoshia linei TaxID=1819745 RepID=A0A177BCT0_9BILA|nr:UbcM4-interacting protein 4 [Intoshia linei]
MKNQTEDEKILLQTIPPLEELNIPDTSDKKPETIPENETKSVSSNSNTCVIDVDSKSIVNTVKKTETENTLQNYPQYVPYVYPSDEVRFNIMQSNSFEFATMLNSVTKNSRSKSEVEIVELLPAVSDVTTLQACPICIIPVRNPKSQLFGYKCHHYMCIRCWQTYFLSKLNENDVELMCHSCKLLIIEPMLIEFLDYMRNFYKETDPMSELHLFTSLKNPHGFLQRYRDACLKIGLYSIPNIRFCPAPDCNYAVVVDNVKKCPTVTCAIETCKTVFCSICRDIEHKGVTCREFYLKKFPDEKPDCFENLKACPNCHIPVLKMEDGSCNHMLCDYCKKRFCWLCLTPANDMHFFSPTGCTLWGKKTWSNKKIGLVSTLILVFAPVAITLLCALSIPFLLLIIPIFTATHFGPSITMKSPRQKIFRKILLVVASILASPFATMCIIVIAFPLLFVYIYIFVPHTLLKNRNQNKTDQASNFIFTDNPKDPNRIITTAKDGNIPENFLYVPYYRTTQMLHDAIINLGNQKKRVSS